MDKEKLLDKVGWITQMQKIPPLTEEYKESWRRFFASYVTFLQKNNFTTRKILKEGQKVTDDIAIKYGDLTQEGFEFYKFGIMKWIAKYDRAKDKDKAINDIAFIEKKLKEFREKQK